MNSPTKNATVRCADVLPLFPAARSANTPANIPKIAKPRTANRTYPKVLRVILHLTSLQPRIVQHRCSLTLEPSPGKLSMSIPMSSTTHGSV